MLINYCYKFDVKSITKYDDYAIQLENIKP